MTAISAQEAGPAGMIGKAARPFWGSIKRCVQMRWTTAILLAVVLVGAVLLRLPAFDRPPQLTFSELYTDEYKLLSNTVKVVNGEPLLAHWPYALYHWLVPQFLLLQNIEEGALAEQKGKAPTAGDVSAAIKINLERYIGWLRYNALFFGLAIIIIVFVLARQIADELSAIAAASIAAVSPVLVAYSRTLYYDLPMAVWYWTTVGLLAWTVRNRSIPGIYVSAALLGWTVATKQQGLALAPVWLACSLIVLSPDWRESWKFVLSRHIILPGLVAAVMFLLNYPTLLDPASFGQINYVTQNIMVSGGGGHYLWLLWLTKYWPGQAHIIVFILLLVGLVIAPFISKDRVTSWIVLAATALYYLIVGSSGHDTLRSIIPLIPGLAIGVVGWFLLLRKYFKPWGAYTAAAVLSLCAVALLLVNTIRENLAMTLPDTAEQANAWMARHAAPMAKVARETYTAHLVDVPPQSFLAKYAKQIGRPAFDVMFEGSLGTKDAAYYRDQGYDYLIANERNREVAELAIAQGRKETVGDQHAKATGKSPRYDGVPLPQILKNYDSLEENFEVAARFTPREPADKLFLLNDHPWWTAASFVHPGIWDLWVNHDKYVLGETETIYRVK